MLASVRQNPQDNEAFQRYMTLLQSTPGRVRIPQDQIEHNVTAMVSWNNDVYIFAEGLWKVSPTVPGSRSQLLPTGENWSNVTAAASIGKYAYATTQRNHF